MAVLRAPAAHQRQETLIVLLPGLKDRAAVFEQEGFIDLIRKHELPVDIVAADAHTGYYVRGTLVRRLHEDVILPAKKHGYKHIILVGVSMGGYGALRYAKAHPNEISTVVLLAPFLGLGPFMKELAEAGDEDFEDTWRWLAKYPGGAGDGYPRILLGYGNEDVFAKTDSTLAEHLRKEDVFTQLGAHLWGTWRGLFDKMLTSLAENSQINRAAN